MMETMTGSVRRNIWNSISPRSCLLLLVLYALVCLAEGRPRTLKKCGKRDLPMGRIVGGNYVQPGDYPWMVSVHEKHSNRFWHVCGGTILNEYYIVTAAHCIDYPTKPWMYEIYVGLHRMSRKARKPARKHKISEVIVHEDFDRSTLYNDIALLRTKKPIRIRDSFGYVNGICLPYSDRDPTGWAIVTGWGHTEEDGEGSDVLQEVKIPLVSRKDCFEIYDEEEDYESDDIIDTQICAGIYNRDSCQNDSGGPLVQINKKGAYTLIGIVSYGTGCGQSQYPGVYTKVSSYMDWLDENMD